MKIPSIMCAVCKREVSRTECEYDVVGMSYRFRVFCHGDKEECELPYFVLQNNNSITEAVAFQKRKLAAA